VCVCDTRFEGFPMRPAPIKIECKLKQAWTHGTVLNAIEIQLFACNSVLPGILRSVQVPYNKEPTTTDWSKIMILRHYIHRFVHLHTSIIAVPLNVIKTLGGDEV
jgi:hypothetical protein